MSLATGSLALLSAIILSACASTGERVAQIPQEEYSVTSVNIIKSNGSIYGSSDNISLYEDNKARNVGDILTIILAEQTNASKTASTTTVKDNNISIENPTLLGSPLSMSLPGFLPLGGRSLGLDSTLSSSKSFSGEGDSDQSNKITGTITAVVTDVYPNGNIAISGKKRITINNGDEYLHIKGIVRTRDISSGNTVPSSKVANAEIAYSGTGLVSDANESGWLTRMFNSKWWPF